MHLTTSLGERVRTARRARGMTLEELSQWVGCGRSYLSQIENGKNAGVPSDELIGRLEGALRLGAGELLSAARWARAEPATRDALSQLQRSRVAAAELGQAIRSSSLDDLYRSGKLASLVRALDAGVQGGAPGGELGDALPAWVEVPLINAVQAGQAQEFTDLGYPARTSDRHVRVADIHDADAFACTVVGESMLPEYRAGDVVVFSPGKQVADGSDCFVRLERAAEVAFKRVWFSWGLDGPGAGQQPRVAGTHTHLVLQALNPSFPTRVVAREEVAGLFPAVSVVRAVRGGISPPPGSTRV